MHPLCALDEQAYPLGQRSSFAQLVSPNVHSRTMAMHIMSVYVEVYVSVSESVSVYVSVSVYGSASVSM